MCDPHYICLYMVHKIHVRPWVQSLEQKKASSKGISEINKQRNGKERGKFMLIENDQLINMNTKIQ